MFNTNTQIKMINGSMVIKTMVLSCICLIIAAVIMVWNSPASGYEASIYPTTPVIFWIALSLNIICGIGITVHQISSESYRHNHLWQLGIFLIIFSYISLSALFIIRGYAIWGSGDPFTHYSMIKEVLTNGHIQVNNFYPLVHIYSAEISSVSGVSILDIGKYFPLIFSLLTMTFLGLMIKSLLLSQRAFIFAIMLIPIYGLGRLYWTPNILSNFLWPLVVFLIFQAISSRQITWVIVSLMAIILIPTGHPLPSIALLMLLISLVVVALLSSRFTERNTFSSTVTQGEPARFSRGIILTIILFIWTVTWLSNFQEWQHAIITLRDSLVGSASNLDSLFSSIDYAELYGYSATTMFFKTFGTYLVLLILGVLVIIPILLREKLIVWFKPPLYLFAPVLFFLFGVIILYFTALEFSPSRFLIYLAILVVPLLGYGINYVIENKVIVKCKFSNMVIGSIIFILTAGAYAAFIQGFYVSPYILKYSDHVTSMEIQGADVFFHYKTDGQSLNALTVEPARWGQFLTVISDAPYKNEYAYGVNYNNIPFHFGYDRGTVLGDYYSKDTYLILTQKDRVLYTEVWPEIAGKRFEPADFNQLEFDNTVSRYYSNGGFEIYKVIQLKD
jgi:hypothetical protein